MSQQKYGSIIQLGYIVEDLDAGIQNWIGTLGVGPWTVFRNVSMEGVYNGEATTVLMDVALGYQNDMQIELIQQTSDTASPYRTDDGKPILGLHHIAWLTNDLDTVVSQATNDGCRLIFSAENASTRVAYLTQPGDANTRLEFIESPATAELITSGIAASRDWDGSNPIHTIDFSAQ